jgi:predicted TIM-barrel fold metal-dependent hydrolase
MKEDLVDFAILIPDNVPDSEIGDVPTCLELVEDTPELTLMGTIDIENQGEEWIKELESLIIEKKIVGMKIFPGHDPIYPTDPRLDPVYEMCQFTEIPMVIHTGWIPSRPEDGKYNDPKYIVETADAYPGLKIVIAHYYWPEIEYCYDLTHEYPNIYYDTSGLADEEVVKTTGMERIQAVLLKTLQDDPEKLIFGTDYAMCSIKDHTQMINQLPVSDDIREGIFWRNAVKVFNLSISK